MVLATQDTARPVRRMQTFVKIAEANQATFFRFVTLQEFKDRSAVETLTSAIWCRPNMASRVALF
jgi:hypothetical protein